MFQRSPDQSGVHTPLNELSKPIAYQGSTGQFSFPVVVPSWIAGAPYLLHRAIHDETPSPDLTGAPTPMRGTPNDHHGTLKALIRPIADPVAFIVALLTVPENRDFQKLSDSSYVYIIIIV